MYVRSLLHLPFPRLLITHDPRTGMIMAAFYLIARFGIHHNKHNKREKGNERLQFYTTTTRCTSTALGSWPFWRHTMAQPTPLLYLIRMSVTISTLEAIISKFLRVTPHR